MDITTIPKDVKKQLEKMFPKMDKFPGADPKPSPQTALHFFNNLSIYLATRGMSYTDFGLAAKLYLDGRAAESYMGFAERLGRDLDRDEFKDFLIHPAMRAIGPRRQCGVSK